MTPNTDEFYVETSPTGADVAGLPLFRSILRLTDSDLSVFSGDAIPAALDLADFENGTLTLEYMDPPFSYPVIAELTSLAYEPAPEPGGALSLAAGMLVLGLCRLGGSSISGRAANRREPSIPARSGASSTVPESA
jgi:hypothetical protein